MKTFKRFATAVLAAAVLAIVAAPAMAQFNHTNTVNNGVAIVSWPTNSVGTNGIGGQTGQAVDIRNVDSAAFFYQGYMTGYSNQAGGLIFYMVRSWSDSVPQVTSSDNDWENTPAFTLTVPPASGLITWGTNLNADILGGANWLGIYAVTNASGNTRATNNTPYLATDTNRVVQGFGAGINTKIRSVRLR